MHVMNIPLVEAMIIVDTGQFPTSVVQTDRDGVRVLGTVLLRDYIAGNTGQDFTLIVSKQFMLAAVRPTSSGILSAHFCLPRLHSSSHVNTQIVRTR